MTRSSPPEKPEGPRRPPFEAQTPSWVLAICAVILMTVSGLLYRPDTPAEYLGWAVAFMILGAVSLKASLLLASGPPAKPDFCQPTLGLLQPERTLWWPVAGGVLLLLIVSEVNGMVLGIEDFDNASPHLQFVLFGAGAWLVAWGFAGGMKPEWERVWKAIWSAEGLGLLLILVLAFGLRVWHLETTVRGLIDETHFVDAIRNVEGRPTLKLLSQMSGQSPYSWIFPYWQTYIGGPFGHNFTGLRITSAIVGTITVAGLWGLARVLMDRQAALLGAFVLATFPPHMHFSRLALSNIADPAFGTLMLLCMAYAIRHNRRGAWALAGLFMALCQYFFEAGRLIFPALTFAWWLLIALGELRAGRVILRAQARGLSIMAAVAVLGSLPFYYTAVAQGKRLFGRMDASGLGFDYWTSLFSDGVNGTVLGMAAHRLSQPFLFYVRVPEAGGNYYYGGQEGLVIASLVPLFLLGFFYFVWRWKVPASLFVLWIAATALANGLLIRDNTVSPRYVVVFPALAMMIACGIYYISLLIIPPRGSRAELLRRWVPVALAALVGLLQVNYYFGRHLEQFNVQFRAFHPYRDGVDAALRAMELPVNTQTFLIGTPEHDTHVPRTFLAYLIYADLYPLESLPAEEVTAALLLRLPRDRNYAFFVDPDRPEIIALLQAQFPESAGTALRQRRCSTG